jgi:hypothetical protein
METLGLFGFPPLFFGLVANLVESYPPKTNNSAWPCLEKPSFSFALHEINVILRNLKHTCQGAHKKESGCLYQDVKLLDAVKYLATGRSDAWSVPVQELE